MTNIDLIGKAEGRAYAHSAELQVAVSAVILVANLIILVSGGDVVVSAPPLEPRPVQTVRRRVALGPVADRHTNHHIPRSRAHSSV